MVNNLILLINLVGLLLMDAFMADLRITQNVPATMEPGTEVRVTVNVEKGDLSGFAKLQLDLPPGLTITAIETKGASFTFADQKAKFIWMALPSTPSFKITYTLAASADASGPKQIEGRLSYIENNERKTYDLPTASVDLGAGGKTASVPVTSVEEVDEEAINSNDLVSAGGGAPAKGLMLAVVDQASGIAPIQGAGGVSGKRTITPISETEMTVEVVVTKGDIRGFGKLQESVPEGFTAMEKSSDEAIFTTQDRVVKFVWLNLPARSTITVVYKLRANSRPEGMYTIDGEFGYLLNDETQKAVLGTSKFFVGPKALEMLAQDESNMGMLDGDDGQLALREKERKETEAKARAEADARIAAEARKQQERTQPVAKQEPVQPTKPATTARIPAPEKGVSYKVQITAAHREVGRSYFQARHRYSGDFSIERHQGWVKYVVGGFSSYKEARDQRVNFIQAGHEFPGPFVTAYNDGVRITVQEALMLSKQQWVQ
jgi:hypothetical protein